MKEKILYLIKENLNFYEILNQTKLTKQELLSYYYFLLNNLLDKELKEKIKTQYLENIFFINLKDNKSIFISDTHIGSKQEKIEYLKQVKSFLKNNDISYLFHGGDLGDGMVNYHKKYNTYDKQIEHLLDVYLDLFDLKQYIICGNHDYKYRKKITDISLLLSNKKNLIEFVGYYQGYFKVFDKIISFEHNSKKKNIFIQPDFRILGHSHECKFKNNSLNLPASCDENTNNSLNFNPGFVTLESKKLVDAVELIFSQYVYTDNGPEYFKTKKYVLK